MSTTAAATPVTYGQDAAFMRFSVDRYRRMIESGLITSEDKVELLENCLVLKMPKNPPRENGLDLSRAALTRAIPVGWMLRSQQTVDFSDSQPEPDFSVVRGGPGSFAARHPAPSDIGLVVEIPDSSLLRDQRDKTRIYARAGLAAYWIVNLVDRRVEVYELPSGPTPTPAFGAFRTFQPGDAIPLVLDGVQVAEVQAADMLP